MQKKNEERLISIIIMIIITQLSFKVSHLTLNLFQSSDSWVLLCEELLPVRKISRGEPLPEQKEPHLFEQMLKF